jgi:uncharacterized circularly permuted ATP-grasp superfamily protein/uncharacterized alpha-E superfamily protein
MRAASRRLFETYSVPPQAYDEVFTASGAPRPQWEKVVRFLDTLGAEELARRWEQAHRMIHENGVTYNVYGDSHGMERPWKLDAIPWVISSAEWERIEVALTQRARLLNAVLADVYGPQKLLEQGVLPPELVFAHQGFIRSCHGVDIPNACYLHFYAADLARTPDGQWWVLADRAQSPAGAGYALENRLIVSSVLSDLVRESYVERLASFFSTLQQSLIDIAPRHRDNPRIVLLTPGPYNETYFEHAYLARYLGYTLAEGADLTVRDQIVYLKTLAGLQPVDVILRRLDDSFCDPLEMNQNSLLGTAGLVQAVRARNVAIANALGSGWLESLALLPLLPALCRHLLGEELALPSVPTWWCGEDDALAYVLEHLDALMLTPVLPPHTREVTFGARLSQAEREHYAAQVRARPYRYAAQEPIVRSYLPVWDGQRVQPQQTVLRVFLVATPSGYVVMPGGLTRVSAESVKPFISVQGDSGSKDTWVLADGPTDFITLLPPVDQPLTLRRSGYEFPSRAADNLFWMGRYAERAEGLVRLLRSMWMRLTNESKPGGSVALPALFRAMCGTWDGLAALAGASGANYAPASYEQALMAATFDAKLASSVRTSLKKLHHTSSLVRDHMTLESWRIVTQLEEYFDVTHAPDTSRLQVGEVLELLQHTIMILSAFSGLAIENMIRGPEWRFLDMGRRLERAWHTTSLLRHTLADFEGQEAAILEALLEVGDSVITYRSRYLTRLQCAPVLDLLLTDETNPRSVLYQLIALSEHVEYLPRDRAMPSLSPTQRLTMRMLTAVRLAEIDRLSLMSPSGTRSQLDTLLMQLLADLPVLSDTITYYYLSHAEPPRHLASIPPLEG